MAGIAVTDAVAMMAAQSMKQGSMTLEILCDNNTALNLPFSATAHLEFPSEQERKEPGGDYGGTGVRQDNSTTVRALARRIQIGRFRQFLRNIRHERRK